MRGLDSGAGGYLRLSEQQLEKIVSNEPIQKYFSVDEEPFARGKYAAVKRCRELASGREYAAKSLKKKSRGGGSGREEILHEVAVLEACRSCRQIVSLHRVFESTHEIVLVLELARGGELQTILDSDEELPTEGHVQELMTHILEGILFLHSINVAHLDIKPQNLILMGEFPSCEVKLCDFGISRYLSEGADVREILGTPDYVAPEVLNYEPISLATDMWSVGVLLYVLLSGCSPFGGDTKQETFCNISQCKLDFPDDLFSDISDEAKDLITKLVVKNPSNRLTAEQCKKHSWFSKSFKETSTLPSNLSVPSIPLTKPRTPVPSKRAAPAEEIEEEKQNSKPIQETEQKTAEEKTILDEIDSLNNNVKPNKELPSRGLSEQRKKSLQSNLANLVERLETEVPTKTARIQRTDSLKRASAMQTMPAFRYRNKNLDVEQAIYKFQRVVIVDEDEGLPPSPPSSSADNSSISDTSSDTISEMSIDSSSDRSSIISLDESLDYHHYGSGKLRHYSSCLNIWDGQHQRSPALRPIPPKECNQSFVLAMSKFRNGENSPNNNNEEQPSRVRLRSAEDRSRFHLFNSNRLSLPHPPPGRKSIGLEFVRETNGNLVVIREVKAVQGKKYSRTSELKCETVQSRIRKLQQIKSDQLGNKVF